MSVEDMLIRRMSLDLLIKACLYCDATEEEWCVLNKEDTRPEWRMEAGKLLDSIFGVGCWDKRKPDRRHHRRITMRPIRRQLRREDKKTMRLIKRGII